MTKTLECAVVFFLGAQLTASATITVISQRRDKLNYTYISNSGHDPQNDYDLAGDFGHFEASGTASDSTATESVSGTVSHTSDFFVSGDSLFLSSAGSNSFTFHAETNTTVDLRAYALCNIQFSVDHAIPFTLNVTSSTSGDGGYEFRLSDSGGELDVRSGSYSGQLLPNKTYTFYSYLSTATYPGGYPSLPYDKSGSGSYSVTMQTVPEPSVTPALLLGVSCFGSFWRHRKPNAV